MSGATRRKADRKRNDFELASKRSQGGQGETPFEECEVDVVDGLDEQRVGVGDQSAQALVLAFGAHLARRSCPKVEAGCKRRAAHSERSS